MAADREAISTVLPRCGAGFVLDDFDYERASADGHRAAFLDWITFKLSRRSDLSEAAREGVFACARELARELPVRLVSSDQVSGAQRRLLQLVADLEAGRRWPVSQAVAQAYAATDRLEAGGRYGDAITWYDLWLWWREEQLGGIDASAPSGKGAIENDLANAYMNRGVAKRSAPGYGAAAAIADYDRAIALMEELRAGLGADWPVPCRNDLAGAYFNRALARRQCGDRAGARRAERLWSDLVREFGEGPWSGLAPRAAALCEEVCGSGPEDRPETGWLARLKGLMRRGQG
jgi:hypothetical protein